MSSDDEQGSSAAEVAGPSAHKVEYHKIATNSLPWKKADLEAKIASEGDDDGFVDLEYMAAGSYEIVKLANGATVIHAVKQQQAKTAAPPQAQSAKAAGSKAAAATTSKAEKRSSVSASSSSSSEIPGQAPKRKRERAAGDAKKPSAPSAAAPAAATADHAGEEAADWEAQLSAAHPAADAEAAAASAAVSAAPSAEWTPLGLHPLLLAAVSRLGFARPTPIQQRAVPAALSHFKDIVGAAETGSGKTLAFGLPIVHRLLDRRERLGMRVLAAAVGGGGSAGSPASSAAPRSFSRLPVLILTPTRELAMQIRDHLSGITAGTAVKAVAIVGGLAVEKQRRQLRGRPDIVIATPGRLWDLLSTGAGGEFLSELHRLQFLVLDEADRLCERGHFLSLSNILASLRPPEATPADGAPDAADGAAPIAAAPDADASGDSAAAVADGGDMDPGATDGDGGAAAPGARKKKGAAPTAAPAAVHAGRKRSRRPSGSTEGGDNADVEGSAGEAEEEEGGEEAAAGDALGEAKPAPKAPSSSRRRPHRATAPAPDEDDAAAPAVDPPSHYKRQTFLFSATLGLSTAQSMAEAAKAMVEARAAEAGGAAKAGGPQLSKKARRRALEAASKLTPVELLMARVGVLGKPEIITMGQAATAEPDAAGEEAGGRAAGSAEEAAHTSSSAAAAAATSASAAAGGGLSSTARAAVALPAGLRLARVTTASGDRNAALYYFLLRYPGRTLIFVNAISTLRRLGALLTLLRLPLSTLHANMQQRQRITALERFKKSPNGILLATDVASRGLDIPSVQYVLHYNLPPSTEVFIHRCGRTARAQTTGLAAAFVGPEDQKNYVRICGVLGLGAGLPDFPVDARYERQIVARLSLATRIAVEESTLNRASSAKHSLLKLAMDADIDVDEQMAGEVGLTESTASAAAAAGAEKAAELATDTTASAAAAGGSKKRRRRGSGAAPAEDNGVDGDSTAQQPSHPAPSARVEGLELDDDDRADARFQEKQRLRAVQGLRRDLNELLAVPLLPTGVSKRYVTANPLLSQTAHPLEASVSVSVGSMGAGGGAGAAGGEGAGAPGEGAAAALPARRSGNALVASRVAMKPEAEVGASRQGAIQGFSSPVEADALATLSQKGKHRYLPPSAKQRAAGGRGPHKRA